MLIALAPHPGRLASLIAVAAFAVPATAASAQTSSDVPLMPESEQQAVELANQALGAVQTAPDVVETDPEAVAVPADPTPVAVPVDPAPEAEPVEAAPEAVPADPAPIVEPVDPAPVVEPPAPPQEPVDDAAAPPEPLDIAPPADEAPAVPQSETQVPPNLNVNIRIFSPGDDGVVEQDGAVRAGSGLGDLLQNIDWTWNWDWEWALDGCDGVPAGASDVDWNWNWTWDWGSGCGSSDAPAVTGGQSLPGAPLEPPVGGVPVGDDTTSPALSRAGTGADRKRSKRQGGSSGHRPSGSGGAGAVAFAAFGGASQSGIRGDTTRSAAESAPRAVARRAAAPTVPGIPKLFLADTRMPAASPGSNGVAAIALLAALAAFCLIAPGAVRRAGERVEQLFSVLLGSRLERPG